MQGPFGRGTPLKGESVEQLRQELDQCERVIGTLRQLLHEAAGNASAPGSARTHGLRRPNAGMRRFVLEAVTQHPGLNRAQILKSMARKKFTSTASRRLR